MKVDKNKLLSYRETYELGWRNNRGMEKSPRSRETISWSSEACSEHPRRFSSPLAGERGNNNHPRYEILGGSSWGLTDKRCPRVWEYPILASSIVIWALPISYRNWFWVEMKQSLQSLWIFWNSPSVVKEHRPSGASGSRSKTEAY